MFQNRWIIAVLTVLLSSSYVTDAVGQKRGQKPKKSRTAEESEESETPRVELPSDPRLLSLHRDFVRKAERLASEYEKANENQKARDVYEQILKLVPNYPAAMEKLDEIHRRESMAERVTMTIHANRPWQDTGIRLIAGKPVQIEAKGKWTFRMTHTLPADGMEIPEKLRDFPLGALVGVIDSPDVEEPEPFFIGSKFEFDAPVSGRLLLRMYDSNPTDNTGKLTVEIKGTFKRR